MSARPPARHGMNGHYQPQISATAAKAQLAMLLCNTTDEKLAGFTAEGLARIYRLKLEEIGWMLELAREQRRRCEQ